jgi:hypothetical protein
MPSSEAVSPRRVHLGAYVDEDLARALAALASAEGRSLSSVFREALDLWLEATVGLADPIEAEHAPA